MSRARLVLITILVLGGLAAFVWPFGRTAPATPPRSTLDTIFSVSALDTDRGIRQFETRVREDPRDFLSLTILGQLYARRARDAGHVADLKRAEEAFRQALRLKPDHAAAAAQLAAAYISQHRFVEALAMVQEVEKQVPGGLDVLAMRFDIAVETGKYREAEETLAVLERRAAGDHAILARRALLAELKGRTAQAVALLQRAVLNMEQQAETGVEIAWFQTRLGDIYFHAGCLAEAEQAFQRAIGLASRYPLALAGLAEVLAFQGRFQEALDLYRSALAVAPSPRRLFAMAAIEERLSLMADATRHREEGEALARDPNGVPASFYRDLAQFYADQAGRAVEALDFAQRDLALRPDVRAYDTLAWALYRNRRFDEAAAASAEALKLGTRDADFLYHAGMIHQARGDEARARAAFDEALALRPRATGGGKTSGSCRLES